LSDHIQFRLDPETRALLTQFASANGLKENEAARTVLEAALRRDPEQAALSSAVWRVQQLMQQGMSRVRQRVAAYVREELVKPFEEPPPIRRVAPAPPAETIPQAPVDEALHGTRKRKRGRRGGR
jgi:hypothetical protein